MRRDLWGRVIFSVTLFLMVFSPLAYGAVEPWARKVVGGGILAVICAWLLDWFRQGSVWPLRKSGLLSVILFFSLILFQLLPLPAGWRDSLSPASSKNSVITDAGRETGSRTFPYKRTTISIHPSATAAAALALAGCVLFSAVIYASKMEPWKLRILLTAFIALGTFEAVYGLFEYAAGTQRIFWLRKTYYLEEVTGTYINHNHFAGLMEMVLPVAIGVFVLQFSARQEPQPESRRRWRILPGNELLGLMLLFISISLMLTALVLSRSRGGLVSSLLALSCLVYLLVRSRSRSQRFFHVNLIVAILLAMVALGLGREISTRFSYSVRDAPERFELWLDSLRIVRDFPWWGTGLGTYRDVLVNYRPAKDFLIVAGIPQPARINYAHNDYLQLLVECGSLGFILLVWALTRTGVYLYSGIKALRDWELQVLGWSLVSGMLALVLHGFVDFNFHIPANALIFSLYGALALKVARPKETGQAGQVPV